MLLTLSARNSAPRRSASAAGLIAAALMLCTGTAAQAAFIAYNDSVYDASVSSGTDPNGQTVHYTSANVTTWGIGDVAGRRPRMFGIAYAQQEASTIPADPWDIRLDGIITDKEVIFSKAGDDLYAEN